MTTNADVFPIANEPTTGTMREHLAGALAARPRNTVGECLGV